MDILQFIQQVIQIKQVEAMAILLIANFCTGLLAGVMTKTLDWHQIKDINVRIGEMFGLYLLACIPAYFLSADMDSIGWLAIRTGAAAALMIFLSDKILINLKEMGADFIPAKANSSGKVTTVIGALPGLVRLSKNTVL